VCCWQLLWQVVSAYTKKYKVHAQVTALLSSTQKGRISCGQWRYLDSFYQEQYVIHLSFDLRKLFADEKPFICLGLLRLMSH